MNHRPSAVSISILAISFVAISISSAQQPQRAGQISRLVPAVNIARGSQQLPAAADAAVFWQDVVKTEKLARARVRLDDGSVINVGPESAVQINTHDPAVQRTELELTYGKVRSTVVKVAKPSADSGFRVRTPVAVAGVVGTEFWVSASQDATDVICLEDEVRVRNADPNVKGEVTLRAGEFTRVQRGMPPTPPAKATEEMLREARDGTDVPVPQMQWTRVEVSWPPPGCGDSPRLNVRAWANETRDGKTIEVDVPPGMIAGKLTLGGQAVNVEDGHAMLAGAAPAHSPAGMFQPMGASSTVETKIWEPLNTVAGEGWRAPRAVFGGSAFYVLGPVGAARNVQFAFSGQPASLLWSGPCGAGFLAPIGQAGEFDVTMTLDGRTAARGKMNLIQIGYRMPTPPTALKGQTYSFGVDLRGLENLAAATQGRPIMVTTLTNITPVILGNLKSATRGAKVAGNAIIFTVTGSSTAGGSARLDATGRGLMAGTFVLNANHRLDPALEEPRTPLQAAPQP